jgi:hypothetical protein
MVRTQWVSPVKKTAAEGARNSFNYSILIEVPVYIRGWSMQADAVLYSFT